MSIQDRKIRFWVRTILILAFTLVVAQTVESQSSQQPYKSDSSASDAWTPSAAEHLGLVGALFVAVTMLWKTVQQKDNLLVTATKSTTEALITAASSNSELRKIIEDSRNASIEMSASLKDLVQVIALLDTNIAISRQNCENCRNFKAQSS